MKIECTKCFKICEEEEVYQWELPYKLDRYECDKFVKVITGLCYECSYELSELAREYI